MSRASELLYGFLLRLADLLQQLTHTPTDAGAQIHNARGLENTIHILQPLKLFMETESIQIDGICTYFWKKVQQKQMTFSVIKIHYCK